jgi:hypothetical protein
VGGVRATRLAGLAVAAVLASGCVRLSAADAPDRAAAERALLSAQQLVAARTLAFRSVVVGDDVGADWRVERAADERTGADPRAVDRVVTACAGGGSDDVVTVDSDTFVLTTANEDALVATQDTARSLAAVYPSAEEAGAAFAGYADDAWAGCVADGLKGADGDAAVVDIAGGRVPGFREDRSTAATRFTAVVDVDGAPVGVYVDVVVVHRDRVVAVLELSAVNRPFEDAVRSSIVEAVADRMAAPPAG